MTTPTFDPNGPASPENTGAPTASSVTRDGRRLVTAALVLGVAGLLFAVIPGTTGFGILLGIIGVVLGILGLRKKQQRAVAATIVAGAPVVLGSIFSGAYGGNADESAAPSVPSSTAVEKAGSIPETVKPTTSAKPKTAAAPKPEGSVGQLQALAAAKGYLTSGMGFSQASLLAQLTSTAGNGFPPADAQWAIDHAGADWNAQALSAAKGYLTSGMGFSEASLTAQLTSSAGNQFTPEQAQYAVANAGADWNAQAVAAAKGYTSSGMGFSRSSLIEQLTSPAGNQFTQQQAEYAAAQVGL